MGDEGGFAPKLGSNQEALDLLMNAIVDAGYDPGQNVFLALDVASTEMFKDGKYQWQGSQISPTELLNIYKSWAENTLLFLSKMVLLKTTGIPGLKQQRTWAPPCS